MQGVVRQGFLKYSIAHRYLQSGALGSSGIPRDVPVELLDMFVVL